MRIGIISENYEHDSKALKALLQKHTFKKEVIFIPICKTIEGDNLLTTKSARKINIDCKKYNINLVVLVKDLDGLPSDKKKIEGISSKIQKIAKNTNHMIIPFIVIFEQEALILADIQAFNTVYQTNHTFSGNPKFQSEPKELLKKYTSNSKRKYKESDTPEIFQKLDFDKVYKSHKDENSFQSFIKALKKAL